MSCFGIHFSGYRNNTCYIARFRLRSGHAAQTCGQKQFSFDVVAVFSQAAHCVQYSDSGAMYNSLWPDIHIRTSGHLAVLRDAKCIEFFPVVWFGIIRNHHAVSHHNTRRIRMRWKQAHWVARIHDQGLFVRHF